VWDWDFPAAPNLVTVKRNGRNVEAVAQITKTGYVYVLDRKTGEPLFPIEQRPVPPSPVAGEALASTQPIPLKRRRSPGKA
jgi:quinoprotein glucose dehydrogenase